MRALDAAVGLRHRLMTIAPPALDGALTLPQILPPILPDVAVFAASEPRRQPSDPLMHQALATLRPGVWTITRNPAGAPQARMARTTAALSATRVADRLFVAVAASGRVGIDAETDARVALNAAADDGWLSPAERRALGRCDAADLTIELGCRWVLKEAYGKAIGQGLGFPLSRLGFAPVHAGIAAMWHDAPLDGWRFALARAGDALLGLAFLPE